MTSVKTAFKDAGMPEPKDSDFDNPKNLDTLRKDAAKVIDSGQMSTYSKEIDEARKNAIEALQKYMDVFAGADNVEKIDKNNVVDI